MKRAGLPSYDGSIWSACQMSFATKTSVNVPPSKTLIVISSSPRSASVSTSGYVSGSQKMICGLISIGATTASTGVSS